ncbi:MAG: glycosyltransferase family 4 protein [Phycisphaerales bacterium]|nr:MAG: glycosyltransferase family 4 protein [Phycisphaerales bacterium]
MKICHLITRLIIGGAQENTVLTCKGLVERGHEVTLVAGPETGPEGSLWDQAGDAGCEIIRLDSLCRAVRPLRDRQAMRDLKHLFVKLRPDVVHTHSSKAGILGRFAASAAHVPTIVHTIHGMSFNRTQPRMTRLLYCTLERWAGTRTTAFVTVADAMIDQAVDARLAPRERFTTIRSGIDTDRFCPCSKSRLELRQAWGVAKDEIVVGTIARLFDNKGYEEILEAMPRAVERKPRLKFVWIGDGPRRGQYERELERMGLRDRVNVIGLVKPDEVARLLRGFDLLVHASRWEGLPRAVVQALLCEVPAISFDLDGAPEVVVSNVTGLLVPTGNTSALSEAIVTLSSDATCRAMLGNEGRKRCLATFGWHKMVEEIEELYERLRPSS